MKSLFLQYPKCNTCQKAAKHLKSNNIEFINRDITLDNPTVDELREWITLSGLSIQKFFNTSGLVYKELNLKEKVKSATEEELLTLLASNGKLVKRPILVNEKKVLVGFKESDWNF